MNVELRQLKHAVAVAEHGSFARAALALHLSQSALSRSVQALEREVGSPIFVRTAGGVAMTEVGRQLLRHGKAMLQVAADMDRQIVRNRSLQTGRLCIGIGTATAEGAVTEAARRMLVEQPMVALEIRTGFRTDLLQPLRSGALDFLLADSTMFGSDDPEFDMQPLEEQPLAIVVRAGHPLARRGHVEVPEIFAYPVVAAGRLRPELLASVLEEQSRAQAPQATQRALPAVVSNSPALAELLVLHSDAVAALPPTQVAGLVEAGELVPLASPSWLTSPVGAAWLTARPPSPAARLLLDQIAAAQAAHAARDRELLLQWLPPRSGATA